MKVGNLDQAEFSLGSLFLQLFAILFRLSRFSAGFVVSLLLCHFGHTIRPFLTDQCGFILYLTVLTAHFLQSTSECSRDVAVMWLAC